MNLHLMWKSSCNIWCTSMVDCLFASWILWYYFKSLWEALATLHALVWLLSSVIPSWIFTWCGKAPVTFWALQWSIVCLLHGSSDITSSLFEKLLPHLMHLYGFSPEWFPSWIFTWCGKAPCHIWRTSMVVSFKDSLMVLQVSWSWEALATLNALE